MTTEKVHSAIQQIIAHENKDKTNCKLYLSTPESIVARKNGNSEIQQTKEVTYQKNETDPIILQSQILDYVLSIEDDYDEIKIATTKEIYCVKVSEDLVQLSEM